MTVIENKMNEKGINDFTIESIKFTNQDFSVDSYGELQHNIIIDVMIKPTISLQHINININLNKEQII